MSETKNSDIHLRPRFKLDFEESQQELIAKFRDNLKDPECKYCSKIVDGHIVIDVPVEDNHFWSPQLNIEIEKVEKKKSIVKGLFGPKPQVWTFFMFIHFAVAVGFIGFFILAYVKLSLGKPYLWPLIICISLPVIWGILYYLGHLGKKKGKIQMEELHSFMMKTLNKN